MLKDIFLIICCVCNSISWLFIMNTSVKRIEKALRQFYLPLKDGHPNEYVKQSISIRLIRSHTGLSNYDRIHWVYCVLHYIQIALVLGTPVVLLLRFFMPLEVSIKAYILFWMTLVIVFSLFADIFACVQATRCSKIRKTNPKYSKCEVYRWKF